MKYKMCVANFKIINNYVINKLSGATKKNYSSVHDT
jgi:hypothetical protein